MSRGYVVLDAERRDPEIVLRNGLALLLQLQPDARVDFGRTADVLEPCGILGSVRAGFHPAMEPFSTVPRIAASLVHRYPGAVGKEPLPIEETTKANPSKGGDAKSRA